ncbi:uncharacterized protein BXZ73DRAFT_107887 [Epithele typhae]|uniref:uncharacterized protein n=1 Tax=Epithele typhae TaxID=378194 RepID=UPI0020076940|nr:uncharacterized protein BXZ73DRAFT_107887 [Epithele typhae]KAH9911618.1 hypothetical protein BXZ73DRAFT_107887 [Epithele typhae]
MVKKLNAKEAAWRDAYVLTPSIQNLIRANGKNRYSALNYPKSAEQEQAWAGLKKAPRGLRAIGPFAAASCLMIRAFRDEGISIPGKDIDEEEFYETRRSAFHQYLRDMVRNNHHERELIPIPHLDPANLASGLTPAGEVITDLSSAAAREYYGNLPEAVRAPFEEAAAEVNENRPVLQLTRAQRLRSKDVVRDYMKRCIQRLLRMTGYGGMFIVEGLTNTTRSRSIATDGVNNNNESMFQNLVAHEKNGELTSVCATMFGWAKESAEVSEMLTGPHTAEEGPRETGFDGADAGALVPADVPPASLPQTSPAVDKGSAESHDGASPPGIVGDGSALRENDPKANGDGDSGEAGAPSRKTKRSAPKSKTTRSAPKSKSKSAATPVAPQVSRPRRATVAPGRIGQDGGVRPVRDMNKAKMDVTRPQESSIPDGPPKRSSKRKAGDDGTSSKSKAVDDADKTRGAKKRKGVKA